MGLFIQCKNGVSRDSFTVFMQCLQALEKMSQEQPLACLQSGAIMAVLNYIDFFSTSIQVIQSVMCSCLEIGSLLF